MRMGRRRTKHRELPVRVYVHHGSYRYLPKGGKAVTLARVGDYAGMLRALAALQPQADRKPIRTIGDLLDRYGRDILPGKAERTRQDQARQLANLRRTFGLMDPRDLTQPMAAEYRDRRAATAPTAANRELELLCHVCTMAVEWGAMPFHPLAGLRKVPRPPRQRYVTDAEYAAVYQLAAPMIRCAMDLALLTGLRRGDLLALERRHMTEDGLEVRTSKTGAALLFTWTPALRQVVDDALRQPPQVRQHILCNGKGRPYTRNGFDSVWQRLMDRATDPDLEGRIERFQFRDLRRKSATDEPDELVASQRLGHTSTAITARVYRVGAKPVRPLR